MRYSEWDEDEEFDDEEYEDDEDDVDEDDVDEDDEIDFVKENRVVNLSYIADNVEEELKKPELD